MGTEFGELPPKRGSCIGFFKQYRKEFVLTQNGKILLVAIVLFGTITTAQFAAAFIANSLALLADCGSMLADVITYVFNFLAECRPNRSHVKGKVCRAMKYSTLRHIPIGQMPYKAHSINFAFNIGYAFSVHVCHSKRPTSGGGFSELCIAATRAHAIAL